MNASRRDFLRAGGGAALLATLGNAGMLPASAATADWNAPAFAARTMADALQALGAAAAASSSDIVIEAPDSAENGAVVPVSATSAIPRTEAIAILSELNPNVLSAYFRLADGTEPYVATRVKMAQTSSVTVLVCAGDRFYFASREI
ncbi:MAG TPA: thiosulfate oxidation carrier protein SoxY, partial [Rhizomicrobium sp.]|nr:thiosulfate oxidation carrier protein SoxY [Rhizomicrobium sp.]